MATGFYHHKYNVLKYRILFVLVNATQPMTSLEIAQKIGIDRKRVTDEVYHWHRCQYGYVKRKGKRGRYYLYVIGKHGIRAYVQYNDRYSKALSLNLKSLAPQKMSSTLDYFGISQKGKDLGYSKDSLPELAGLKKRNLDKDGHS